MKELKSKDMGERNNELLKENIKLKERIEALEKISEDEIGKFEKREEELKLKLLFYESIANSTVDGFLVVNPHGQKVFQTQRTIDLWKIPQEVVDNPNGMKQVEHVMHMTVDPKKFVDEIKYQIEHPFEKRLDEVELIDGTIMERYSSPVIDGNGKNHGRIYTFHDITDQKEIEKNLHHLNNQKDRFISVLAHDLRGPVSGLLGLTDILSEELKNFSQDKIEEMIKAINVSAKKTFDLLEDTLTWMNASLDKVAFSPEVINVNEIIDEVYNILEPMAKEKNISLINHSVQKSTIYADVYMIKAILRNLVSNSIKFTNEGGRIEVSVLTNDLNTTVQVVDNGVGIPTEKRAKLFNISTIYSAKGTANETGTGMGLLLCKEFVDKHDGKIWIDSEENVGTTVAFSLPKEA